MSGGRGKIYGAAVAVGYRGQAEIKRTKSSNLIRRQVLGPRRPPRQRQRCQEGDEDERQRRSYSGGAPHQEAYPERSPPLRHLQRGTGGVEKKCDTDSGVAQLRSGHSGGGGGECLEDAVSSVSTYRDTAVQTGRSELSPLTTAPHWEYMNTEGSDSFSQNQYQVSHEVSENNHKPTRRTEFSFLCGKMNLF